MVFKQMYLLLYSLLGLNCMIYMWFSGISASFEIKELNSFG